VVVVALIIAIGLVVWAVWERSNVQKAKTEVELALEETQKANAETKEALAEAEKARKVAEQRRQEAEAARKEAEEDKQWALEAENRAENRRKEAEEALQVAEEQRLLASEAGKKAELNSSRFQEMVSATFGFLSEKDQTEKFLGWIDDTLTIQRLIPALQLMIDSSEMDENKKKSYHNKLPDMTGEEKVELFGELGREAVNKASGVLFIHQIMIKDVSGANRLKDEICVLTIGEKATIEVEIGNPSRREITIEYSATQGKIERDTMYTATYTAPGMPGSIDIVTITVLDKNTDKTIAQDSKVIQIIK
jgi:multidrug efflux pump subunit AcrA (membrane-fusion protein)